MLSRYERRIAAREFKVEQSNSAISYRQVSHDEAEGPFSVRPQTPRYCSITDGLIGTREHAPTHEGLQTYGWAVQVVRGLYRAGEPDDEVRYIIRDARGRQVFQSSLYDLRGRKLPVVVPVYNPDELSF
jgi:hypothetical protein